MFDKISKALLELFPPGGTAGVKIQSVYDYEASLLKGYPALTLTPSANENEYSTTTENRRVYAFMLRLYVERPSSEDGERACEKTMRTLVDNVLDTIDKNFNLTNLSTQTGYTYLMMQAAPSQWAYAGIGETLRVAEIRIQLHFDIDTTLIT